MHEFAFALSIVLVAFSLYVIVDSFPHWRSYQAARKAYKRNLSEVNPLGCTEKDFWEGISLTGAKLEMDVAYKNWMKYYRFGFCLLLVDIFVWGSALKMSHLI
jgi:hypothetical protein